jgi:bifunctional DNA-binding transcriptional regulator/antitoxin component of YhaV-PrlF toxin-antitoxin module
MKATTLTISSKGQTLMPLDWRKDHALTQGGSCNAFYLEDGALLIVPVKPPGNEQLRRLLTSVKPTKPPRDWKQRVQRAIKDVRR